MKAVIHSRYGNPEVLQVTTLERPVPQKNEVLIRVKAAGLDDGQWHLTSGKPFAMPPVQATKHGCAAVRCPFRVPRLR
jgi:NADPH:quinone reductase-like Zn-dependent oxidoreductase